MQRRERFVVCGGKCWLGLAFGCQPTHRNSQNIGHALQINPNASQRVQMSKEIDIIEPFPPPLHKFASRAFWGGACVYVPVAHGAADWGRGFLVDALLAALLRLFKGECAWLPLS